MDKPVPQLDKSSETAQAVGAADYIVKRLSAEASITALALPATICFRFATPSAAAPR